MSDSLANRTDAREELANRRVVVRCDAAPGVGLGHLSRCLNLADALAQRGCGALFVMRQQSAGFAHIARQRGFEVRLLDDERGEGMDELSAEDCAATLDIARVSDADWIVLDSYAASERRVADLVGDEPHFPRLAIIDDMNDRDLGGAALVVNPTPGSDQWRYRVGPRTTQLCGAQYALMHAAFAAARETALAQRRERALADAARSRGLVCLGGMDTTGATARVISAVAKHTTTCALRVIYGGGDEATRATLRSALAPIGGELLGRLQPAQLAETMAWADWAVATPSTIAWELACLGVRPLLLEVADNQRRIAEALRPLGVAICRADDQGELEAAITAFLAPVDATSAARATADFTALCDGRGATRVAAALTTKRDA